MTYKKMIEGAFTINLEMTAKYKQTEPSLMAEYKCGTYHKSLFVEELIYILAL